MASVYSLLPYILILIANLAYLYKFFSPEFTQYQILLFNFFLMAIIGIVATIHVNILLHNWIVQQSDKGQGGITKKQIIKKKVMQLILQKKLFEDLFNQGNQIFFLKVYLGAQVLKWFISLLPDGLTQAFFFLYGIGMFKQKIKRLQNWLEGKKEMHWPKVQALRDRIIKSVPKYTKTQLAANTQSSSQNKKNSQSEEKLKMQENKDKSA